LLSFATVFFTTRPETSKKKRAEKGDIFAIIPIFDRNSVAVCPTQLPNHPSGTTSERRNPQKKRDAGWRDSDQKKTHPPMKEMGLL
jgi:hypothetical protein